MNEELKYQFDEFRNNLDAAMEANDVALVAHLFNDERFGSNFYEFYLCSAAETEDSGFLDLMLSFEGHSISWRPLGICVQNNNIGHIKKILPRMSMPLSETTLMESAVLHGYTEIVRLLAPRYDHLGDSLSLVWAIKSNNQENFDLIYPLSNVPKCLDYLKEQKFKGDGMRMFKERIKQDKQHQRLTAVTDSAKNGTTSNRKKL